MIWAIYLLCQNPAAQEKARAEIRRTITSLDGDVTAEQIDSCHYLQALCQEIMRLWAPVSLTMRVADCDTSINGQFVPKGTSEFEYKVYG